MDSEILRISETEELVYYLRDLSSVCKEESVGLTDFSVMSYPNNKTKLTLTKFLQTPSEQNIKVLSTFFESLSLLIAKLINTIVTLQAVW